MEPDRTRLYLARHGEVINHGVYNGHTDVDITAGGVRQMERLRDLLKDFPQKLIYRQSLFPIRRSNGSLVVATSDPFDLYPLDEVSAATGLFVTPVLAGRKEIAKLIKKYLGVGGETGEGLMAQSSDDDEVMLLEGIEPDGSELSEMAQEASVVRLVNEILLEAIELKASDVHIESELLASACEGGMSLFTGLPRPSEGITTTDQLQIANYQPGKNIHLFSGSFYLCYQRGMIDWLEQWNPDGLIVEANPRYLSTPAAVRWMHRRNRPVIGWGLGSPPVRGYLKQRRASFVKQFDAMIAYSRRGAEEYAGLGFPRPARGGGVCRAGVPARENLCGV